MRAILLMMACVGCSSTHTVMVLGLDAAANPNSTLSAIVSFRASGADAARVVTVDGDKMLTTPDAKLAADGTGKITVLGLAPQTMYTLQLVALDKGKQAATASVDFTTGALPADLAGYSFQITPGSGQPRPGYYLVSGAATRSAFAVDENGQVRWYHSLLSVHEETKMQPDSSFTSTLGTSMGWQAVDSSYRRYTPAGDDLATYQVTSPDTSEAGNPTVYGDLHELLVTNDGTADHLHLLAYEMRPTSASDATPAAWHEVVRQSPAGDVELRWKSWSRFTFDDVTETIPVPGAEDIDHTNALAINPVDNNYVVSFRDLDALIDVDYNSGAVNWQLGGKQNQLTVVGDPLGGFFGQHSVRVLDNGNLLIYDNGLGHTPPESRAVEYQLDLKSMTATMVWQYRHSPAIFTPVVGSVERWQNGHTLVAFALNGVVDEVDADSNLVWEGQLSNGGNPASTYRVRFLPSLYQYAAP
jgi:hypothetical protein